MSADVIIPADVAKDIAAHFRKVNAGPNSRNEKWADLLDPQPPSLREQAAEVATAEAKRLSGMALAQAYRLPVADAVLAVVADWLAAQPLELGVGHDPVECVRGAERDHDVRLLRGAS